jgi:DNA polymerase I-like protein with 3'-5' exonuclease and polymerase domains
VLQVHDELVLEGPEALADAMVELLKDCMENTTKLPGVALVAEPKVAKNLGDLK